MAFYLKTTGGNQFSNGVMLAVASPSCADVAGDFSSFLNTVWGAGGSLVVSSCSSDPIVVGTLLTANAGYGPYVVSEIGSFTSGSFGLVDNFDSTLGGQFFMFGLVGVLSLYFFAHGVGQVLKLIRS